MNGASLKIFSGRRGHLRSIVSSRLLSLVINLLKRKKFRQWKLQGFGIGGFYICFLCILHNSTLIKYVYIRIRRIQHLWLIHVLKMQRSLTTCAGNEFTGTRARTLRYNSPWGVIWSEKNLTQRTLHKYRYQFWLLRIL